MATNARRRFFVIVGAISVALVLLVAGVAWARQTASDDRGTASALLQVEPYPVSPFGQEPLARDELDSLMRTQVELIRSPNVLSRVSVDPKVAASPSMASPKDAEAAMLEQLEVTILPDSYLIRVSAPRLDPADARPARHNAVIDNFLMLDAQWSAATHERQIEHLTSYMNDFEVLLTERRTSLESLERDGATVEVDGQRLDRSIAERDLLDCLGRAPSDPAGAGRCRVPIGHRRRRGRHPRAAGTPPGGGSPDGSSGPWIRRSPRRRIPRTSAPRSSASNESPPRPDESSNGSDSMRGGDANHPDQRGQGQIGGDQGRGASTQGPVGGSRWRPSQR